MPQFFPAVFGGLGGFASGAVVFTPASLSPTAWYDPSDISTLFQDSAGTTPVTASGDPVGRMNDKSGNGNHLIQATAGKRPLFNIASSLNSLIFDGVDDSLQALFTLAQPHTRVSAFKIITWINDKRIFDGGTPNGAGLLAQYASPQVTMLASNSLTAPTGTAAVGSYVAATEFFNSASSTLAINNGANTTGDPGNFAGAGLTIGDFAAGTIASNVQVGRILIFNRALTAGETANCRTWVGAGSGLVL